MLSSFLLKIQKNCLECFSSSRKPRLLKSCRLNSEAERVPNLVVLVIVLIKNEIMVKSCGFRKLLTGQVFGGEAKACQCFGVSGVAAQAALLSLPAVTVPPGAATDADASSQAPLLLLPVRSPSSPVSETTQQQRASETCGNSAWRAPGTGDLSGTVVTGVTHLSALGIPRCSLCSVTLLLTLTTRFFQ